MKVFARAESAEEVRAVLRGWLVGRVPERELVDAQIVATELVANTVLHAGLGPSDVVRVRAMEGDGVLHLEVEDPGRAGTPQRREDGIGLNVVDALALHWGVARDHDTVVWADLPLSEDPPRALL
jgi:anti-sigma regulatory factor (Ser/Thr protein kinase)